MQLTKIGRRTAATVVLLCTGGSLFACSSEESSSAQEATSESSTTSVEDDSTSTTTTVDGASTTSTTVDPEREDDPTNFAFGQELKIVDGAVQPKLLAADSRKPITIRNTTDTVQEVLFPVPGWDEAGTTTTGPMAPGAVFTLDPIGLGSIKYQLAGAPDVVGSIQVEDSIDEI